MGGVPTTGVHMETLINSALERLRERGLGDVGQAFVAARLAHERSEWALAMAETRRGLDRLLIEVARQRGFEASDADTAVNRLRDAAVLSAGEADLAAALLRLSAEPAARRETVNADAAYGRLVAALALVWTALAHVPELHRLEDILIGHLLAPPGGRLPTDREIYTTCASCSTRQTLSQAQVGREGRSTVYRCMFGCQPLAVVGPPTRDPWGGQGFRLGDYLISNEQDIFLPIVGSGTALRIPAMRPALSRSIR